MKKQFFFLTMIVCLGFALSGCGASGPSTSINVELTDFHFTPDSFTILAGEEITVSAINNGAVEHEFVIFKFGENAGDKFNAEDESKIFWEVELQPGESKTETFTAPTEAGEYYVTCGTAGHLEAGMSGKLLVVK